MMKVKHLCGSKNKMNLKRYETKLNLNKEMSLFVVVLHVCLMQESFTHVEIQGFKIGTTGGITIIGGL